MVLSPGALVGPFHLFDGRFMPDAVELYIGKVLETVIS